MEIKHLPFVAGMASLALILGAYSFEHIGGLHPCKLCLWQRYP
ncbi:MAG: disulfide bond formation protein B, partial [Rhodobacterales bacterium]|nr:disulfide bond formation protein B [Rhodobacterales bacterium]